MNTLKATQIGALITILLCSFACDQNTKSSISGFKPDLNALNGKWRVGTWTNLKTGEVYPNMPPPNLSLTNVFEFFGNKGREIFTLVNQKITNEPNSDSPLKCQRISDFSISYPSPGIAEWKWESTKITPEKCKNILGKKEVPTKQRFKYFQQSNKGENTLYLVGADDTSGDALPLFRLN